MFAIGSAPASSGLFDEPMFAGMENIRGGDHRTTSDPVRFTGLASIPSATF